MKKLSSNLITNKFLVFPLLLAMLVVVTGCPPEDRDRDSDVLIDDDRDDVPEQHVDITMDDFMFQPAEINARPGQRITVHLTNNGTTEHSIRFDWQNGDEEGPTLDPGETDDFSFNAPDEPGNYTFYCPIDNHREMGMQGTLVVRNGVGADTDWDDDDEFARGDDDDAPAAY